jgi:hypothetical protein
VEFPAWGIERHNSHSDITTTVSLGSTMSTGFQSPSNAASESPQDLGNGPKETFHRASIACKACHSSKVPPANRNGSLIVA